jgi:hypothetical protein
MAINNQEDALTAAFTAWLPTAGTPDPRMLAKVAIGALDIYAGKVSGALASPTSVAAVAVKTLGNQR